MKRLLLLGLIIACCAIAQAQKVPVIASTNTTHIRHVGKDTIVVATGSIRRFTVDTPEDKGLVSTGIDAALLPMQFMAWQGKPLRLTITNKEGVEKKSGEILSGDRLLVMGKDSNTFSSYYLLTKKTALSGTLSLEHTSITTKTNRDLTLYFTAGQRSPDVSVTIFVPAGITVTPENTTVNVIGRGDVRLKDLPAQSIGRAGVGYPYSKVGEVSINKETDGSTRLEFKHLDLRPANGADLKLVIHSVMLDKAGDYSFRAHYTTAQPEKLTSAGTGPETAKLSVLATITDFRRVLDTSLTYGETASAYTSVRFAWGPAMNTSRVQLMQSLNSGQTWQPAAVRMDPKAGRAVIAGLIANRLYAFKLVVQDGPNQGSSNMVRCYTGKMDIKSLDVSGKDGEDATDAINTAIAYLSSIGGGTLLFSKGVYAVRTIRLESNVYLYIAKDAVIKALKGGDAPETTWFSDLRYRSGLSPTDMGPYADPENYLTKQDVGHHYFRNAMFFGERLDNIKIIGNGLITGNSNLVTSDKVMSNAPDNRCDKMFSLKLCTRVEIGGLQRKEDLWYDSTRDEPYYIGSKGEKITDTDNMLHIDRAGHFALLATGTDNLHVHDTYFGKANQSNARDIYDFMACNHVTVTNIYSRVSSDDIVKPGSDCSLGFTRPARDYKVRNVIGDTNCNLFQIGSETADDITDVYVDNIYVLGANKAGFSISTNDGAHVKNIYLNSGRTGSLHSRSKMLRTATPFFISISNRGRIIGAEAGKYSFMENGKKRDELLVKNVNIGEVENIFINGIDIIEAYGGSSYGSKTRWKAYDGSQKRTSSIVAGYSLPADKDVTGGLHFQLPNGKHTGYINHIEFNDVHLLDKGGNPLSDTAQSPPELGVGQYNASNLKVQPSYGLWAKHVNNLLIRNSSFRYEQRDSRYALFLDDVTGARLQNLTTIKAGDNKNVIGYHRATDVQIENLVYYQDQWGLSPVILRQGGR